MAKAAKWETAQHDPGDLRREMQEGHGGKLVNMLVGLIINSNDAYERESIEGPRRVTIEVDKTKTKSAGGRQGRARVRVVDWAQGMDYEDLGRSFQSHGGPKSQWQAGKKISGLFGREASDIMWSNVASRYLCIKDGRGYSCQFRPLADFRRHYLEKRDAQRFQGEYETVKSLTIAEFYLDEDYSIPHFSSLVDGLSKHFRLRLINQNPNVYILLAYTQQSGSKLNTARISFLPLEKDSGGAELIEQQSFSMQYKGYPEFKIEAQLHKKKDRDLTQSGIDREGGLLIFADDETVIELSLLGLDDPAYTAYNRRFFGYVRLHIADILRQELRHPSQRLALIEADRSQLKRRNSEFYDRLKQIIDNWLRPHIEKEQAAVSSTAAPELTGRWNRRLRPLLAEINRVINEKTGRTGVIVREDGTPPDVMKFGRDKITTSEGTVYRIELLFNAEVIQPGSAFEITSDNTRIHVDTDSGTVPEVNHPKFPNVARKTIRIWAEAPDEDARVDALVKGHEPASVQVFSVEAHIHVPTDGLEWWPADFHATDGEISHPTLWVDMIKMKPQGLISISSPDDFIRIRDSSIETDQVPILREDVVRGIKVGRVRPRFTAEGKDQQGQVLAAVESFSDALLVHVLDKQDRRPPGHWTFTGIQWEVGPSAEVDLYPNAKREVCFNVSHPLITSYFGSSATDAPERVKNDPALQRLAAHMVVDFILNQLSRDAWRSEDTHNPNLEMGTRDRNRMDWEVYNYVMKLKGRYGPRWVEHIVGVLGS